jgi:hypothetical protein
VSGFLPVLSLLDAPVHSMLFLLPGYPESLRGFHEGKNLNNPRRIESPSAPSTYDPISFSACYGQSST